ncbi:MAG TPA: T9SS type B sorting domain-containing protein, partial [Flavobacteriaceae bacterium]
YTFQVRDANDCTYSESYTIDPLPGLTVVGQELSNVSCFGSTDGSALFTVSGTTSFTYTINGGASTAGTSPINLSGLAAGTYTIVITDTTTNCQATDSVTIDGPSAALTVSTNVSPITCVADGSVTINAVGGWGGNTYELTLPDSTVLGPQGSNVFTNLSQVGMYTVTVTDANGCQVTATFTLSTPSNPTATIDASSDYCYDGSGSILVVNASGGLPPYEYSINGGAFGSSNTFTNLIPGTYDIIVRDANGCTFALPTQTIADQLTASAVLTKRLDCTSSPDAVITGTISGGYAPYTVTLVQGTGTPNLVGNTFTLTTSTPGNYQFQITDASGCTALTNVITIQSITNPSATAIVTDVFCNSDSSGIVTIDIDENLGEPPYLVSFDGSPFTSQTVYNGLASGTYNYTVRDSNSCEFSGVATVTEPSAITLGSETITPITCGGSGNVLGSISISNVTGGTPNYTYTLLNSSGNLATTTSTNPFGPTPNDNVTFDGLTFGNYYLRIIDGNGCEYNFGPYLVASDVDELDITANASGSCLTGVDYDIHIVNGIGPFEIRIYNGTPFNPGDGVAPNGLPTSDATPNERNHQFSGLQFDVSYVFEVLDTSTGCTYIKQIPAEPSPSPMSLTGTATNVACLGDNNGTFDFTVSGYTGVSLSWEVFNDLTNSTTGNNGSTAGLTGTDYSDTVTGLGPGDYYLLVTETDIASTQCTAIINFRITEPTELLLAEVVNTNANCNQDAQVVVNGSGGTPPYEYAFVEDGVVPSAGDWTSNNLAFLDYTVNTNWDVYVRDANGCNISTPLDVVIASDPLPSVTLPTFADDQCTSIGNSYTFTATPGGGEVTPVSYSIDGVSFQSSPTFTVSSDGTYTVTIRDGNGCTATDTITIYPPLQVNALVSAQPSCTVGGTITVTGAGGSGSYSFTLLDNLGNPTGYVISGSDFTGIPAGDYSVEITDTVTACSSQTPVSLETPTPVSFTTTVSDVNCNSGSDGVIIVNLDPSNDNPLYTYAISGPISVGPQASNIFTGLPAGTYDITVTSGRDCSLTQQVTVGEPTLLTVSGTATDFACAPDNSVNASVLTITEVGGTAPYLYSIDGINYFSSNSFDIIDTGSLQTIDIYVKDANGCIASDSVSITPLPTLTAASVATATPIDCNNTGTVTITVTGGSGNFDYQMLPDGTPQASNTFSITDPGTYYFQVNDLDTGCTIATSAFTVAPFDTIDVTATPTTAITCYGDSNGAFEISVSGYSGTYDYEVFNDSGVSVATGTGDTALANPQVITGMSAGNYTVEVTETASPFCSTTSNMFTIDSPASALVVSVSETSNVTCDDNQGTITAIASGGWGAYEYELTGAATVAYSSNGTFTNLSAGNYTVNVRDAGGCIASDNVTLVVPPPINATVTPSATALLCFGDTSATITVTNVTGGQGSNYSYTLNMISPSVSSSGPQASPVFSGLGAGTYTVDVTDGYNCIFTSANIVITEPTQIQAELVKATSQTCLTDATLTLSATGGTGTYEYSDTDTFATVLGSFASSVTFSVSPGTHEYYVRDANGCVSNVSNEITTDELPPLVINLDLSNATINCTGDTTGVIVATAQGGLGSYVYTLQDTSGNDIPATQNSPGVFTDLPAGDYRVKVDSGDCLTTTATISITEPSLPLTVSYTVTDVTCNGIGNGILEINASGGTGIIKYAISPQMNQFFDDPVFDNLMPGDYQAIVQDELGCYVLFDFTINEPTPVSLTIVPNSIIPEVCEGDMNGEFSIDISGGNLPYSVSLDDIDGVYTTGTLTQTQFDFTGLSGGDHIVYVRDALDCESEWNITFPESVKIDPVANVEYLCENNVQLNRVTVTVDPSITDPSDLDYSLNGGPYQSSNVFINVPPGIGHYIDVRHTNGCIQRTDPFDITQYDPLTLVIANGGLNEIVATATGGSGVYEFTLNGESYGSTNTFIIYSSGNYTVTVTDSFGCVASATGYFEYIDVCIPNYFTPNGDGVLDGWGPGCTSQYGNLTFSIFDRYGRKVATLNAGEKWDGKYNGMELPTGDYWYVVKLNDPKDNRDFVGHFTLYR